MLPKLAFGTSVREDALQNVKSTSLTMYLLCMISCFVNVQHVILKEFAGFYFQSESYLNKLLDICMEL